MPGERILISGAGVAGSVLAFYLAKHSFRVVVIERSRSEQKAGQGIEIEQPAIKVVRAMGILDKLNAVKTGEAGFELVDERAKSLGRFDVGGLSPTGALELMRGDLTEVLWKRANESEDVEYRFETTMTSLRQTGEKVFVELENRRTKATTTEEFDLVVGADGVRSRTRQLVMGSPGELDCFKPVGAFVAYFSIPREPQDYPYSRMCHFPGRRVVWIRPTRDDSSTTSVYLIHLSKDVAALRQANAAADRQGQKEGFAELYTGLGWETPRMIKQMLAAENFYSDELVQVKLPSWSQDRVVLVGDAAWAPTPFTGQGNQLAIIGAWVLAQELSRERSAKAFETYERRLRPYVQTSQQIPLGGYAPFLFVPETRWGIWVFRTVFWAVAAVVKVVMGLNLGRWFPSEKQQEDEFDLEMGKDEGK